jgi:hypothetical protein
LDRLALSAGEVISSAAIMQPINEEREDQMSKPTHIAYVVTNPKEGSEKDAVWNKVGAVWPHKNGNGFDLVIPEGISLSGRIVITERKEKEPAAE